MFLSLQPMPVMTAPGRTVVPRTGEVIITNDYMRDLRIQRRHSWSR